jgi:hypothetical protein
MLRVELHVQTEAYRDIDQVPMGTPPLGDQDPADLAGHRVDPGKLRRCPIGVLERLKGGIAVVGGQMRAGRVDVEMGHPGL